MTDTTAQETADNFAQSIRDDVEAGFPFGRNDYEEAQIEQLSAYDWLEDALDIEYRVGGDGAYRSARVLVGWGGPNIWVDTARQEVQVSWYSPIHTADLPVTFCETLDEVLEELWSVR